ncbi:TetR/AcrR family transcriptional regulator [Candidatus Poribacteria bacterium]|nr:TetR/AcrR family transcriptional regulator [Candidatus Poribacteria bacterium]
MSKPSAETSKLSVKRTQNRNRILDAAEALFYEKGFSSTPLRKIIKKSGLSTTVFYSFFPTKVDVLIGLILPLGEEINRRLNAAFKDSTSDGDPIEKALHIALQVCAKDRRLTKIFVTETAALNLQSQGPLRKVTDRLKQIVIGQLDLGVAKGYFRSVDPTIFAYSFIATFDMHLYRWAVLGELSKQEMIGSARALAEVFRCGLPQSDRGKTKDKRKKG